MARVDPAPGFLSAAADLIEGRVRRQLGEAIRAERGRCARLARDRFRDEDNAVARAAGEAIARLIEEA